MGPEKKVLYIVQSLVAAYIVTGLLLCLLAFIVYQSNTGTKMANLGITLTYIFASILAGIFVGVLYFAILTLISVVFQENTVIFSTERITALFLCIAGGTLGGMLAI